MVQKENVKLKLFILWLLRWSAPNYEPIPLPEQKIWLEVGETDGERWEVWEVLLRTADSTQFVFFGRLLLDKFFVKKFFEEQKN